MKTKKELDAASESISTICDKTGSVITMTNKKGMWTARLTRKTCQIYLVAAPTMFECIVKMGDRCQERINKLGIKGDK